MGATTNNESSTTESPPQHGQQPRPLGVEGLDIFYWPNMCPSWHLAAVDKKHKYCLARMVQNWNLHSIRVQRKC